MYVLISLQWKESLDECRLGKWGQSSGKRPMNLGPGAGRQEKKLT